MLIDLHKFAGSTYIVGRHLAVALFNEIKNSKENKIILDFSNITLASKSFFVELHSKKMQIKLLGKELQFENLNKINAILWKIIST